MTFVANYQNLLSSNISVHHPNSKEITVKIHIYLYIQSIYRYTVYLKSINSVFGPPRYKSYLVCSQNQSRGMSCEEHLMSRQEEFLFSMYKWVHAMKSHFETAADPGLLKAKPQKSTVKVLFCCSVTASSSGFQASEKYFLVG